MKNVLVAAGLAGILVLSACASAPNVRGTVTEKEYEPAKRKKIACYELEITDADGLEHDFCVTKKLYDSYRVGDTYPRK